MRGLRSVGVAVQVKKGEIPLDKVPYMQRGGAWDDSDLSKKGLQSKTSKKISTKSWTETDKKYASVREQVKISQR